MDPSRFETASAERSPGERELARGLVGEQLVEQGRFNHAMRDQLSSQPIDLGPMLMQQFLRSLKAGLFGRSADGFIEIEHKPGDSRSFRSWPKHHGCRRHYDNVALNAGATDEDSDDGRSTRGPNLPIR